MMVDTIDYSFWGKKRRVERWLKLVVRKAVVVAKAAAVDRRVTWGQAGTGQAPRGVRLVLDGGMRHRAGSSMDCNFLTDIYRAFLAEERPFLNIAD
jgi:hypothetical protein